MWVSSIFKSAAADRIIGVSPCRGIKTPTVARTKVEPLAAEKVAQLVQAAPERYRALIVLGAGTGVRISVGPGPHRRPDGPHAKESDYRSAAGRDRGGRARVSARSRIATTRPERFRSRRRSLSHWRSTFGLYGPRTPANLVISVFTNADGSAHSDYRRCSDTWRAAADPLGCPRAPVTTRFATTTPARSYGQGRA